MINFMQIKVTNWTYDQAFQVYDETELLGRVFHQPECEEPWEARPEYGAIEFFRTRDAAGEYLLEQSFTK